MPAPEIYINGWPGVGKYTVAKHLQRFFPGSEVLHNHEVIDPVEEHFPRGSAYYQQERATFRRLKLNPIMEDPEQREVIWIFTDSQTEHNECMGDYTDLELGEHGRRFYSVVLECDEDENIRRLTSPGRGGEANRKLTDVKVLKDYRSREGIYKFEKDDEIVLDVTSTPAEETAAKIAEFVEMRERGGRTHIKRWDEDSD